jgi:aldehyde:ferredoxin oxidoreductase
MTGGYTGKILRVDLSKKSISTMDTEKYESWIGGHGMGSAVYWDLCKDKTLANGFDLTFPPKTRPVALRVPV